jgi:hypothetical protein
MKAQEISKKTIAVTEDRAFSDWAKKLAATNRERARAERDIQRATKKAQKSQNYKPPLSYVYWKANDVISQTFPDGDPFDHLTPWLQSVGLTMDDVDAAIRKYHGGDDFYTYLANMWDGVQADSIQDAKNGHIDNNSVFYNVGDNGSIIPSQNPWTPWKSLKEDGGDENITAESQYSPLSIDQFTITSKEATNKANQVGLVITAPETAGSSVQVIKLLAYSAPGHKDVDLAASVSGTILNWKTLGKFKSNKIWIFFKPGVDEASARDTITKLIEDGIKKNSDHQSERAARQADAPARKKEMAKLSAQDAKANKERLYNKWGKNIVDRVTVKQIGGDDGYQWNVLVDGRPLYSGLTRREVRYYKSLAYDWLAKKAAPIAESEKKTFNVGDEVRIISRGDPDHMESGKVVKVNKDNGNGVDHKMVYVKLNRMRGNGGDTKMFWDHQLSLEHSAKKHKYPPTPAGQAAYDNDFTAGKVGKKRNPKDDYAEMGIATHQSYGGKRPQYEDIAGGKLDAAGSKLNKTNIAEEGITGGKLRDFANSIVAWWNAKLHPENNQAQIRFKNVGSMVWTRGDGVRYRDPAYIISNDDTYTTIDQVWNALNNLKISTPVGAVSQDFRSAGKQPAIRIKGFILVKRLNRIDIMTKNRVKNPNSVWSQDANESVQSQITEKIKKPIAESEFDSAWHGPNNNPEWYQEYKDRPIRVKVKNHSGLGNNPSGTYTVRNMVKISPTEVNVDILVRGEIMTGTENLDEPKTVLNKKYDRVNVLDFYCGSMPITARQAFNLFQTKKRTGRSAIKQ